MTGRSRGLPLYDARRQLIRAVGDPIAIEAKKLWGILHPPEDGAGEYLRPDRVQLELELRDDAEVAAATAHAPEKIFVVVFTCVHELAFGGDQVHRGQVVDRQPVLPHQEADPTAQGEAGHPGVRNEPGGDAESECLRLAIELTQQDARLDADRPSLGVDPDAFHGIGDR